MKVNKPGCVWCSQDHDARKCNYQLALLIESYIEKHNKINVIELANEITKVGYVNANL